MTPQSAWALRPKGAPPPCSATFAMDWQNAAFMNAWFEHVALVSLMFVISLITLFTFCVTIVQLFADAGFGTTFMGKVGVRDTFGSVLTVLILFEFNHSIFVALTQRTGAIQVRIVVLIADLVVVRKIMLLDFGSVTAQVLLAPGGLLLCLGGLYWLLAAGMKARQDISRRLAIVRSTSQSHRISRPNRR
jgi:uncharacterized membrane protein (DUF373 family)